MSLRVRGASVSRALRKTSYGCWAGGLPEPADAAPAVGHVRLWAPLRPEEQSLYPPKREMCPPTPYGSRSEMASSNMISLALLSPPEKRVFVLLRMHRKPAGNLGFACR